MSGTCPWHGPAAGGALYPVAGCSCQRRLSLVEDLVDDELEEGADVVRSAPTPYTGLPEECSPMGPHSSNRWQARTRWDESLDIALAVLLTFLAIGVPVAVFILLAF